MSERLVAEQIRGGVQQPQRHDSAWKHVSGEASFIDDLPERADLLHVYLGISARAHAGSPGSISAGARGARRRRWC